jgi:phosphotriesterase-related protein
MTTIHSVSGPLEAQQLGRVLMHEHVFILDPDFLINYPELDGFDEARHVPDAIVRLNELKAGGIDTIVDLTVLGIGRNIERIATVQAETDLQILVATGLYTFNEVPHVIHIRGLSYPGGAAALLTEMFVGDITEGIAGTGVRAAILKCATDAQGVTPDVELVLRAVARAQRATGVPISTHTHALTKRGLEQQDVFESEGVDLSRVVIGHSGDTTDLAYLEEIMRRGSFIGMDRFGIDPILSFDDRVATVATLCERGHADQMVLSHDAACFIDLSPNIRTHLPNSHYLHITRDVLPALEKHGVSQDQIDQMLITNPRRIFDHAGGAY